MKFTLIEILMFLATICILLSIFVVWVLVVCGIYYIFASPLVQEFLGY